jgi:hypothetical protein
MNRSLRATALAAGLVGLAAATPAQTTIAKWAFTQIVGPPYNTPTPTSQVGTANASATQLGMTNNYTNLAGTGSTASCDVTGTTGDPNPAASGFAWRVRGSTNNGWADAAPQWTQGAEFDTSTVGYTNITFSFDWFSTTQGIRDLQLQYTLDGSTWTNWTGTYAGNVATQKDPNNYTQLIATSNNYNTVGTNVTANTVDFSGITGAANNAHFGIRLVSAYDSALSPAGYASAQLGTGNVVQPYNNSSGNWRFDQIQFAGQAVPEVNPTLVFGLATLGLLAFRVRRS